MNAKSITDALTAVAAVQPDIAIALSAYQLFKGIWQSMNPGKTEADFQNYLQTASQTNIDVTASYLKAQGFTENPPGSGNWTKPAA